MNLHGRLSDFIDSLSTYPPTGNPDGLVVDTFNALLDVVKEEQGSDPVVAAIRPIAKTQSGRSAIDAGSLLVAARQLLGAVPEPERGMLIA